MKREKEISKQEEVEAVHRDYPEVYDIIVGVLGWIILVILIYYMFFEGKASDYSMNIVSEVAGILATVIILDRLNSKRLVREQKSELIFQLGSNENISAREALRKLRFKGWLLDGSLRGAFLKEANLENADLENANLTEVDLSQSNLKNTKLSKSNLSNANLSGANLSGTNLLGTNLSNANLSRADISGTDLSETILIGASLNDIKFNGDTNFPSDLRNIEFSLVYTADTLTIANLQGVNFQKRNLRGVVLKDADLRDADLRGTDLRGADLRGADLRGAKLESTDMRKCLLWGANMENAIMTGANLEGAIFLYYGYMEWHDSNLQGATLPNGKIFNEFNDLLEFDIDREFEEIKKQIIEDFEDYIEDKLYK